jgi:hypothetical protein
VGFEAKSNTQAAKEVWRPQPETNATITNNAMNRDMGTALSVMDNDCSEER